jgi:isopentenyl diphosphate isomerase/L-lactate dehydrogenase-like FMN-dependent dehydrogenase
LLGPATVGADEVVGVLEEIIDELRIAMFCIGAADLGALRDTPLLQRIDGA